MIFCPLVAASAIKIKLDTKMPLSLDIRVTVTVMLSTKSVIVFGVESVKL